MRSGLHSDAAVESETPLINSANRSQIKGSNPMTLTRYITVEELRIQLGFLEQIAAIKIQDYGWTGAKPENEVLEPF